METIGVYCLECLCDLQPTKDFGADVMSCPRCGGLWMSFQGMRRLTEHLRTYPLDTDLGWQELVAQQQTGMAASPPPSLKKLRHGFSPAVCPFA